jgi:hypothetical protein
VPVGRGTNQGFSSADQDAALCQPERHRGLLGVPGRNEVVAAVRPDLVAGGEREELPVPPLRLYTLKHRGHDRHGLLGVKQDRQRPGSES